jgi:hypothetical protein
MEKLYGVVLYSLLGIMVFSCKKNPLKQLSADEKRIYITHYDSTANFNNYLTFSVHDSVALIENNQSLGKELDDFDSKVILAVQLMMGQRGYQLVKKSGSPDLAVDVSKVYSSFTGIFSYPDYWDFYYSYWDPIYWGYPFYPYYAPYNIGIYTIETGALSIDLLDLKNAAANGNKIRSIWSGLAKGAGVFNSANAASDVAALFSQSAYLKH